MKKILKTVFSIILVLLMIRACQMEYVCDVVDSIPKEIQNRIIESHPECADIDLLAEFWIEKGDSIVAEIAAEQEYERELQEYLETHNCEKYAE